MTTNYGCMEGKFVALACFVYPKKSTPPLAIPYDQALATECLPQIFGTI